MKVICDRAALMAAINTVSRAVAARTPRVQLTCVKLSAVKGAKGGGELLLAGTDAEISMSLTLAQVDVQRAGDALIPADKLRQIVAAEENEPTLTIEVSQDACHIRGADAHFKLLGYPPAEFPPIPDHAAVIAGKDGDQARAIFTLQAGDLRGLVERTLFATARENTRYAINGVLLKRDGKRIEMVATDGRRLALCRGVVASDEKEAKAVSCIVPTKALNVLRDLVRDPEEIVRIAITATQVHFAFGGDGKAPPRAVLVSNLVEGAFPPYEEVIPRDNDRKVVFDRDVVRSAVGRAALLTNDDSRGVRMKFSGSGQSLELSSRAPEMGEAEIKVDLSKYEGEDLEIGFNPTFLTEALKVIPENEIIMELKAPNRPGLVKAGNDFLYVVMPVNVTS